MLRGGLQLLLVCETWMPPQEESTLMQEADTRASETVRLQRQEEQEARLDAMGETGSFFMQLSVSNSKSLSGRGALPKLTDSYLSKGLCPDSWARVCKSP